MFHSGELLSQSDCVECKSLYLHQFLQGIRKTAIRLIWDQEIVRAALTYPTNFNFNACVARQVRQRTPNPFYVGAIPIARPNFKYLISVKVARTVVTRFVLVQVQD